MISKHDLKRYDFTDIEQYFDYIVESYHNGQMKQVNELCEALSREQRRECVLYIGDNYSEYCEILKYITQIFI
jgi:predicted phosphatase